MISGSELTTFQNYTIGAITGFSEAFVTNPLFVIKTKIQQGKPIPWGFSGLYKGFTANALGYMPVTAVQVGSAQWMEKKIFSSTPSYKQKIGAAFTAGVLSSFISCPVEMIMTLQSNAPKLNLITATKFQFQTHGLSGLFIGQSAMALREGNFAVFFLAIAPLLKNIIKPYCVTDTASSVVAGVCSGVAATLVTQPLDTIKTMQQSNCKSNLGFFQTAKTIGPLNLFKGILSRSSSIIISITLMSWMRETLEDYCEKQNECLSSTKSVRK